ncbi:hypothetical protein YpB42003004_0720 [Yersinia pestis biovar Antiqua str. B42003004]|nr:hypothetical protein YpAngola_A3144 [Yersinia pestis Angola]EDR38476.1 hypothetical protein YpF1991016_2003 [Yersinia pestis biovar Orientalis str. F1991016]EDR42168.1 hypothetical protein YpE1979001_0841 [Yersinia pestis biovar Antiqua str. E1979001]EDR50804.1 hypothetical protein YpB42003004_0720 [Yersinia pestis biovar Antiqua str. B42003004]EDR66076.1 hypothetical protein YpK1973002_3780 [Yersinia pestis biovar Mediaevalis str. K1973002]UFA60907.1 Uncharacterized protein YP598_1285 [Yer
MRRPAPREQLAHNAGKVCLNPDDSGRFSTEINRGSLRI